MIRRSFVRAAAVGAALVAVGAATVPAQGPGATTVYLVRHAEKGTVPAADPPLTPAGEARALALAVALVDAGVTSVITSDLLRTKATAQPLAASRRLVPATVTVRGGTVAHVAAVADSVRARAGGVVLVVGHSNTIPLIIAALGGPKLPDICDAAYSNLFVLTLEPSRPARLARVRIGAADPEGSESCAGMTPK